MAIDYTVRYPGQVDVGDAGYPYGRARNVNSPGAGDGTPFERDLVNDIFGFHQGLLFEAGLTPSGSPDTRSASQYMDAIRRLTRRIGIRCSVAGSVPQSSVFDLALDYETTSSGFVLGTDGVGDYIQAPETGYYLVSLSLVATSSHNVNPLPLEVQALASAIPVTAGNVRWSTNTAHSVYLNGTGLLHLGGIGENLYVANAQSGGVGTTMSAVGKISVVKVSGGASGAAW